MLSLQIAPVVTASSSQSRADVLVIVLSAVLLLTGLQWLSLKPRPPKQVELEGREAAYLDSSLPASVVEELRWCVGATIGLMPVKPQLRRVQGMLLC